MRTKETQKRIYDIMICKFSTNETLIDAWFADEFDPSIIFVASQSNSNINI